MFNMGLQWDWLVGWLAGTSPNSVFRDFFSDFSGILGSKSESTIQGATFYRGMLSCLPRFPGPAKLHSSCLIDPHPVASFFDERTTSKWSMKGSRPALSTMWMIIWWSWRLEFCTWNQQMCRSVSSYPGRRNKILSFGGGSQLWFLGEPEESKPCRPVDTIKETTFQTHMKRS